MAKRELPSPELLRQLLDYDCETGAMFFRTRLPIHFADGGHTAEHNCAAWNAKWAGSRADRPAHPRGYATVRLLNYPHLAHRVAWAHYHECWPSGELDHINGEKLDNRISNLRVVSRAINNRNIGKRRASLSGIPGVRLRYGHRWHADICGKYLGSFDTMEEAVKACKQAAYALGFTSRHGSEPSEIAQSRAD